MTCLNDCHSHRCMAPLNFAKLMKIKSTIMCLRNEKNAPGVCQKAYKSKMRTVAFKVTSRFEPPSMWWRGCQWRWWIPRAHKGLKKRLDVVMLIVYNRLFMSARKVLWSVQVHRLQVQQIRLRKYVHIYIVLISNYAHDDSLSSSSSLSNSCWFIVALYN